MTAEQNVASLLKAAAASHTSSPAILEGDVSVSFEELAARAAGMAEALRVRGVERGHRVGILLPRGADAAAAYFGIVAIGAIAVPLNEQYRAWQVRRALVHVGATLLVSTRDLAGETAEDVETLWMNGQTGALSLDPVACGADEPAHMVFTSGSTGPPKAVLVSHSNVLVGNRTVTAYLGLSSTDRVISLLPFSFVYGFSQLMSSIMAGACLIIVRAVMAQDIVEEIARTGGTVLASVPAGWTQLLRSTAFTDSRLPKLRILTCAGGRLPVTSVRDLRERFPGAALFLMYGLTEAFRSTFLRPDEVDAHPDSMGRAVPGSEVLVVRPDNTLCEAGEVGELVHSGPTVALGYWNDPDATALVFRPDPRPSRTAPGAVVYSGDLVQRDVEGRLFYVGRRDHVIKSLGYRISPDEVTDVLLASGMIVEAAVVGEPDAERGQRIVAHVVIKPTYSETDVRRHSRAELPTYMQPARYVLHLALPRTATGKLDLVALRSGGDAS